MILNNISNILYSNKNSGLNIKPIDVILTSYNRFDLLEKTLESFFKYNTYPINNFYIYDDFGYINLSDEQKKIYREFEVKYKYKVSCILGEQRIGQIKALDLLTSKVETEYYFTLEEDWEFMHSGFIEKSFELLQKDDKIIQVWLRGRRDTNNHPTFVKNGEIALKHNYLGMWHGFSFNPGLRRLSDYKKIGSYAKHAEFDPKNPCNSEAKIGKLYKDLCMYAITTKESYVKHIGYERGIRS